METVQIRLKTEQLKRIDNQVKRGVYRSRSDAIRDYLERMELLSLFRDFQELIESENLSKELLLRQVSKARERLYKKYSV